LRAGDVVPERFVVEHAGIRCMDQRGNGACVALDPATFLCSLYADRPQTCRDFNRGEDLCRSVLAAGRNLTTVARSQLDSSHATAS
jgi:Fe-S-cluster containining protein